MKRLIPVATVAALLALAAGSTAFATQHVAKAKSRTATHTVAAAACVDGARCNLSSCPVGSRTTAMKTAGAVAAQKQGAACANPASCSIACPRESAGAAVATVVKR